MSWTNSDLALLSPPGPPSNPLRALSLPSLDPSSAHSTAEGSNGPITYTHKALPADISHYFIRPSQRTARIQILDSLAPNSSLFECSPPPRTSSAFLHLLVSNKTSSNPTITTVNVRLKPLAKSPRGSYPPLLLVIIPDIYQENTEKQHCVLIFIKILPLRGW